MTPYYEHGGITIYHGDCREVLPVLPSCDLLLTDPPYGIALDTEYSRRKSHTVRGRDYAPVVGDESPFDGRFLFGFGKVQVVWGANNWPQAVPFNPMRDGWIVWDKRTNEAADRILGSPFELAVVVGRRCYEMIRLQHCGVKNADGDNAGRFHPTQKPVALMTRVLRIFRDATVLDPFMGSGTVLIAAKESGRRAIGIEIEERYCEIAAKRLAQEVLPLEVPA